MKDKECVCNQHINGVKYHAGNSHFNNHRNLKTNNKTTYLLQIKEIKSSFKYDN